MHLKKILILACVLGGCITSNYTTPKMNLPNSFIESKPLQGKLDHLKDWWKSFNDPLLDELITEAIAANYDIRIAKERLNESRAVYQEARSALFPTINLTGETYRTRLSQYDFFGPAFINEGIEGFSLGSTIFNFFRIGFDALWEIDIFGKNTNLKEAAFHDIEVGVENIRDVEISTTAEVALLYVNIRAIQQKLQVSFKYLEAENRISELTDSLYNSGLDSQQNLLFYTASINTIEGKIALLQKDLKQSIYQLAALLGTFPENIEKKFVTTTNIPNAAAQIPALLPSDLLKRRPDIRRAEKALQAAYSRTAAAKADFFPHFSLEGSRTQDSFQLSKLLTKPAKGWLIGSLFNWRLIDFGKLRGELNKANSVQKQTLLFYKQTVTNAIKEVESAMIAYLKEQENNGFLLTKKIAKEDINLLNEDLYKSGLYDFPSVLEGYEDFYISELDYLDSQQALMSNLIAIYKSLGGEW